MITVEHAKIKFVKNSDNPKERFGFARVVLNNNGTWEPTGEEVFAHHGDCQFVIELPDGTPAFAKYDRNNRPPVPEPETLIVFLRQPARNGRGDQAATWANADEWDAIATPAEQLDLYVTKDGVEFWRGHDLDELGKRLDAEHRDSLDRYTFQVWIESSTLTLANGQQLTVPAHWAPCDCPVPALVPA